jgi:glutathione S-transferase
MFQMSSVGPMFGQALHFKYIAAEGNDYAQSRFRIEVERLYDVVERRLATVPHLAGELYSIADIAAFPWMARYLKSLVPRRKPWIGSSVASDSIRCPGGRSIIKVPSPPAPFGRAVKCSMPARVR